MTKVSVIVIDNYDYGWFLGNYLAHEGFEFMGRITHGGIIDIETMVIPDVAVISFDDTTVETRESIDLIRQKFPAVKIIINSIIRDRDVANELMKMPVHGMVFDALKNQQELKNAIDKVLNNETYFPLL